MGDVLPIEIRDHDPRWPEVFASLRDDVLETAAACDLAIEVHHVGSTSVPGLPAKPIIDLLVVSADLGDASRLAEALDSGRWTYRPGHEEFLPARRFCQLEDDFGRRIANLHVFASGDPAVDRHLAFPAQLRARADARAAYVQRKRELAARHVDDVNAYAAAKTELIREIESAGLHRALEGTVPTARLTSDHLVCDDGEPATLGPDALAPWWFSRVDRAGEEVRLTMEEEYGYRRHVVGIVRPRQTIDFTGDADQPCIAIDIDRIEREWDDAPGGVSVTIDVESVRGSCIEIRRRGDVAHVRWSGMAPDAHDVARREGEALLHAIGDEHVERPPRARGVTSCVTLGCDLPVSVQHAWGMLFDAERSPIVLGSHDAWLRADPGRAWSLGMPSGTIHGRVLVAVAGRRLVLSWNDPTALVHMPLELDVAFLRAGDGSECTVEATIGRETLHAADAAARARSIIEGWLSRLVDQAAATAAEHVHASAADTRAGS